VGAGPTEASVLRSCHGGVLVDADLDQRAILVIQGRCSSTRIPPTRGVLGGKDRRARTTPGVTGHPPTQLRAAERDGRMREANTIPPGTSAPVTRLGSGA